MVSVLLFMFTVRLHVPGCGQLGCLSLEGVRGFWVQPLLKFPKKWKKLKPKTLSFSDTQTGGQRTLTQPFVSVRGPPKSSSENEAENRFNEFAVHSGFSSVPAYCVFVVLVHFNRVLVFN